MLPQLTATVHLTSTHAVVANERSVVLLCKATGATQKQVVFDGTSMSS